MQYPDGSVAGNNKDMKRLSTIQAEILIEVIKSLNKIDKNSTKLGKINIDLGKTNTTVQRWVLWLTVGLFILALATLALAGAALRSSSS